jgi:hypothetical protein
VRSTRYLAGALAGAASIAATSLLAIPASADVAFCSDAQATYNNAASVEQGTRGRLSAANSALNAARATLGNAVSQDSVEDAITPDTGGSDALDTAIASAQTVVNSRVGDVSTAQNAENTALSALGTAQAAVNTACNPTVPTPTPAPVGLPTPTPNPVVIYKVINGKKCHLVNGTWVPVTTVPASTLCTPCVTSTLAPATVFVPPPVTIPAPATQTIVEQIPTVTLPPAQAFTTQIAPSVPVTSAGDGSLAAHPIIPVPVIPAVPGTITVTLNLNGVLHVILLPRLPVIPVLPAL